MIAAGEQCRPRWRAYRRRVELVVAKSLVGQRIEGRHVDRTAEGARLAEAHIVEQNDHYIGRTLRRFYLEARWRGGVARVKGGDRRGCRLGGRQHPPGPSPPPSRRSRLRPRSRCREQQNSDYSKEFVHNFPDCLSMQLCCRPGTLQHLLVLELSSGS